MYDNINTENTEKYQYWLNAVLRAFNQNGPLVKETTFDALIPEHLKQQTDKGEQQ